MSWGLRYVRPVAFLLTVERNAATLLWTFGRRGETPLTPPRDDRSEDREREDILQGTLDMLVLRAVQLQPMHGWGITDRIEQWSGQVLKLGQGTLYPALYRLERQGLIASSWQVTEHNRRARYYAITAAGRRRLKRERQSWERMSRAINLILNVAE